jgi:hypothetical protein
MFLVASLAIAYVLAPSPTKVGPGTADELARYGDLAKGALALAAVCVAVPLGLLVARRES